ncbi:8334_t:CDS:2 [Funneliformis geosporum]|nr:8334_t:CDS:2 [Funneliformis geosporum]
MDINNDRSLYDIAKDVLRDALVNTKQWNFKQFIKTNAWKPDKDNKASKILTSGEHFSYIVIHPDTTFNLRDRKLTLTKGEKMEFVDVTKELDKKLDLYHYFEKTIIGFYVRFIMCDKKYELTLSDKIMQIEDPDKKYKQIDDYAQKKVKS